MLRYHDGFRLFDGRENLEHNREAEQIEYVEDLFRERGELHIAAHGANFLDEAHEDAESGAGNVFEPVKIEHKAALILITDNALQKSLELCRGVRVQLAGKRNDRDGSTCLRYF